MSAYDDSFNSSEQVIGICSICGGDVTVPLFWWSSVEPKGVCRCCGAIESPIYRKVIPMMPKPTKMNDFPPEF